MNISYTLRLTNNSITFLSTFLDKGKDNIWIKEIIDILYKNRWGWRAKDSGQWSNPSWPQHRPQLATTPSPAGPSPFPSPAGRGVICEVTPTGLLTRVVGKFFSPGRCLFLTRRKSFSRTEDVFFSHGGCLFLTRRMSFSLTELTDLTEHFNQRFELTDRLRHTDFTERYC